MASLLDSIGLRASVNSAHSYGAYFSRISNSRTRVQIGFSGWFADYPSAAGFIPPILSCAEFVPASPDETSNFGGFCDRSTDAEMSRASVLQAQDPPAATLLWQKIERELLAQAPLVPMTNSHNVDFVSKRVGNYQYNPQWGVLLSQLWVK
jgi:peptide/nickel transport system substrate-binding protein